MITQTDIVKTGHGVVADGLARLLADTETVVSTSRVVVHAAEGADDPASPDLATRRIAVHEKTLWMLRATAGEVART